MADVVDRETRSRMMAGIRSKNTRPEMLIRRGLHAEGFRYRLHKGGLPGKPDLVLLKWNAVVFVHGCFWHVHDCPRFKWPSSREEFWRVKLTRNRARDTESVDSLVALGWRVLIVWECALIGRGCRSPNTIIEEMASWIRSCEPRGEIQGGWVGVN